MMFAIVLLQLLFFVLATSSPFPDWNNNNTNDTRDSFLWGGGDWLLSQLTRVLHCRTSCRTTLSFHRPTENDFNRLFGGSSSSTTNNPSTTMEFNHPFVGSMTNPSIIHSSVTSSSQPLTKLQPCATTSSSNTAKECTTSTNYWIPDTFMESSSFHCNTTISTSRHPSWRTFRIRKTVGYGKECYEALRDVILHWEGTQQPQATSANKSNNSNNNTIRLWNYLPPIATPTSPSYCPYIAPRDCGYWYSTPTTTKVLRNAEPIGDCEENCSSILSPYHPTNADVPSCYQIGGAFKKLITISKSPYLGIWVWNPCQVLYDLIDQRYNYNCYCTPNNSQGLLMQSRRRGGLTYTATAYGTLKGHLIAGEERVSVAIHDEEPNSYNDGNNNGKVEVEILSYSHATNSILGKLIFPFIKGMQEQFFKDQITTLERIGKDVMMKQPQYYSDPLLHKRFLKPFTIHPMNKWNNNFNVDFCAKAK